MGRHIPQMNYYINNVHELSNSSIVLNCFFFLIQIPSFINVHDIDNIQLNNLTE